MTKFKFNISNLKPVKSIGLGTFDGFHKGHQELAKHCEYILSLFPHPVSVLKGTQINYLTTPEELKLIHPNTLTLTFTKEIANLEPEEFLKLIIKETLQAKKIVVGYDYHFGKGRNGNLDTLKIWGKKNNIEIKVIEEISENKIPIKSKKIREDIANGNFKEAIQALGHPYPLIGKVIKGEGRGKSLGFPTANLSLPKEKLLPPKGVYKAILKEGSKDIPCICYNGTKPTFSDLKSFEVHIPNDTKDLYGQTLKLLLTEKIRDEIKFNSKEALIAQIKKDIACL